MVHVNTVGPHCVTVVSLTVNWKAATVLVPSPRARASHRADVDSILGSACSALLLVLIGAVL